MITCITKRSQSVVLFFLTEMTGGLRFSYHLPLWRNPPLKIMSNIPSTDELTKKAPVLNYLLDPVKNHYVDFEGTATRQQYWMFVLVQTVIVFVLSIVAVILGIVFGMISDTLGSIVGGILFLVVGLFCLALLLPSLGIMARRLRDAGFSPWLMLLGLVGLSIVPLIMCCLPSQKTSSEG